MSKTYPRLPEKVFLEHESKTQLLVGQSENMIYPISKCCRVEAKTMSTVKVETLVQYWYCTHCRVPLKRYVGEIRGVSNFESGPEGPWMVLCAISAWTGIPREDLHVGVEK